MNCAACVVLLGAALALAEARTAAAQETTSASTRRAAIASERTAIDQRFGEQEAVCRQRFVVTSCLNDARQQRRAALAPLRQEELRIDTEERKQRAADRLGEIEAKQRADAARETASAPQRTRSPPEPPEPARPAGRLLGGTPKAPLAPEERARREAESEARFERRQQESARHREAVAARNAERAAKGKLAKPLPVPAGASSP